MKIIRWCFVAAVVALVCAEIGLRMAGVLDFPLFEPGPPYGYIPRPNQSGAFLNHNDWVFNELSMGTDRPFQVLGQEVDTLLIGDSIVSGGNPYRQSERLGPQLERRIGGRVWPISANSWALANELTYIRLHPEVARNVDRFIFVTNSEDFLPPSVWRSPVSHPTKPPLSALVFVAQKKISPSSATPVEKYDVTPAWRSFLASTNKPVMVVAYPSRIEATDPALRRRALVERISTNLGPGVRVIDVGGDRRWKSVRYRDRMHPDPAGTEVLATILADEITTSAAN